jgi:stalled ribosome rescue protein Dom34
MKIQSYNYANFARQLEILGIDWQDFNRLRLIEKYCNRIALRLCNEGDFTIPDDWSDRQIKKVKSICPGLNGTTLIINLDPRVCSLQVIDPPVGMYRGISGYGIVAPEF